jgi:NTE family protein
MNPLDDLRAQADALARRSLTASAPAQNRAVPVPAPRQETHSEPVFGLVLAGGAAKGAYELGVIDFLAEHNVKISAVAGTSIGALNGAVIASNPDLRDGAERLSALWDQFTRRFGEAPHKSPGHSIEESTSAQLNNLVPRLRSLMVHRGFLDELVANGVDPAKLRAGRPFWVGAYPMIGEGNLFGPLRHAIEWARWFARDRGRMLRLNDHDDDEIHQAILASAALPFIFQARIVRGKTYRDGWIGGDNTPIRALADEESCDAVVVAHLGRGEIVNDREHPNLVRIDILPSRPLQPNGVFGAVSGLLDFSPSRAAWLRDLGYRDAQDSFARVLAPAGAARALRTSQDAMLEALDRLRKSIVERRNRSTKL